MFSCYEGASGSIYFISGRYTWRQVWYAYEYVVFTSRRNQPGFESTTPPHVSCEDPELDVSFTFPCSVKAVLFFYTLLVYTGNISAGF